MWLSARGLDERLVRRRQHRQAGSEARAEDADRVVALALQPGGRLPGIEHGLATDLRRPPDVGAHDVIGATQLGRHAFVVVGQAESKRRESEAVEQMAQADVSLGVGIPLRQHDDRASAAPGRGGREEPGADRVVLRVRRLNRARVGEPVALERVVRGWRDVVEVVAAADGRLTPGLERRARVAWRNGLIGQPVDAPLERTGDAVGRCRREAALPAVEGASDHGISDLRRPSSGARRTRDQGARPVRSEVRPATSRDDPRADCR